MNTVCLLQTDILIRRYTSCERGTNKRINRDIRKIFPKGTNFANVTDKQVKRCEDWINHYPRQIFDFVNSAR